MPADLDSDALSSSMASNLPRPSLVHEISVNTLNYCAYDMVLQEPISTSLTGWIAVPNSLESAWIDVYEVPAQRRIVEALGKQDVVGTGTKRPPIVMSLQTLIMNDALWIIGGYEDGSSQAWALPLTSMKPQLMWTHKSHSESIMALCVAPHRKCVVSVGADYAIVRTALEPNAVPYVHKLKRPGHSCVCVRWDERICMVGSWDASVRAYSIPAMEQLAKLTYHKDSIYALSYTRHDDVHVLPLQEDDSDDEIQPNVPLHLLACGGKDGRISLWHVPFTPDEMR